MISRTCLENRFFLVVDDEAFVRSLVTRFLNRFGAAGVVEAADGREAIAAIQSYEMTFDAVLSDVRMKNVNGIELLRAIRTGAGGLKRNMPFLMLTAHAEAGLVADALAFDADAFVLKPVKREELIERVLRIIDHNVPIQAASVYEAIVSDRDLGSPKAEKPIPGRKERTPALSSAPPTKPLLVAVAGTPGSEPEPAYETWTIGQPRRLPIDEVKPNSVLAEDLFMVDTRRLLLGAPTTLTSSLLDRLKDLARLHESYGHLVVIDPAA